VLASRPGYVERHTFEFGLGNILVHELGSYVEGSKNSMTDKYTKVCGWGSYKSNANNKAVELFQTVIIVSMNMGNLNLEINILKNRLAI
jgi:hypothetical protein